MKLYTYYRSQAAFRVRIALNLKGLSHDDTFLHLEKGDQFAAEYRAVNPQMVVPTLIDGDAKLFQSLAILEYLEETYPEPPLLPPPMHVRPREPLPTPPPLTPTQAAEVVAVAEVAAAVVAEVDAVDPEACSPVNTPCVSPSTARPTRSRSPLNPIPAERTEPSRGAGPLTRARPPGRANTHRASSPTC